MILQYHPRWIDKFWTSVFSKFEQCKTFFLSFLVRYAHFSTQSSIYSHSKHPSVLKKNVKWKWNVFLFWKAPLP